MMVGIWSLPKAVIDNSNIKLRQVGLRFPENKTMIYHTAH